MTRQTLVESTPTVDATPIETGSGRFRLRLISPGWGSSGYYGSGVLEAASTARVFPAGTQMYLDHPTRTEEVDRPERSVRELAAVLAEDASWDGSGLVAEARVFSDYRRMLEEKADAIGVSIRATAEVANGEAEGRRGVIVEELVEGRSVDFVTRAGRGGEIMEVLESARVELEEAKYSADQLRAMLQKGHAFRNADGEPSYPIEDEEDLRRAIRAVGRGGAEHNAIRRYIIRRAKALGLAKLIPENWATSGSSESDDPVIPAGVEPIQEEGLRMPQIQVDEAEHRTLTETAGRVPVLESERDAAIQRAELAESRAAAAEAALLESRNEATAARIIAEAAAGRDVTLDRWQSAGIAVSPPLTSEGVVDEEAMRTRADEACTRIAESAGAGRVRGFGPSGSSDVSEADADNVIGGTFGVPSLVKGS